MIIVTAEQNFMLNTDYIRSYGFDKLEAAGNNSTNNFTLYAVGTRPKGDELVTLFHGTETECKDVFDHLIVAFAQGQRVFDVSDYQIHKLI